jgi:hypothetical protein
VAKAEIDTASLIEAHVDHRRDVAAHRGAGALRCLAAEVWIFARPVG